MHLWNSAYRKLPSSPEAAAYRGFYLCKQGLFDAATDFFEEAIEREIRIGFDVSLITLPRSCEKKTHDRKLEVVFSIKSETARLLKSLLKARELGDSRAELYRSIGGSVG